MQEMPATDARDDAGDYYSVGGGDDRIRANAGRVAGAAEDRAASAATWSGEDHAGQGIAAAFEAAGKEDVTSPLYADS